MQYEIRENPIGGKIVVYWCDGCGGEMESAGRTFQCPTCGQQFQCPGMQEVEADRDYFGKEHALPFRMAINPQPRGGARPAPDSAWTG